MMDVDVVKLDRFTTTQLHQSNLAITKITAKHTRNRSWGIKYQIGQFVLITIYVDCRLIPSHSIFHFLPIIPKSFVEKETTNHVIYFLSFKSFNSNSSDKYFQKQPNHAFTRTLNTRTAKRGDWTTAQRAPAVKALFFVRQSNVKICLIIVVGWVSLKISAVPYVEVLFYILCCPF